MSGSCGEDALVERACRQLDFFVRDGSKLRGGRGNRGYSRDSGISGLNWYSEK